MHIREDYKNYLESVKVTKDELREQLLKLQGFIPAVEDIMIIRHQKKQLKHYNQVFSKVKIMAITIEHILDHQEFITLNEVEDIEQVLNECEKLLEVQEPRVKLIELQKAQDKIKMPGQIILAV